jgi:hypothetical protein
VLSGATFGRVRGIRGELRQRSRPCAIQFAPQHCRVLPLSLPAHGLQDIAQEHLQLPETASSKPSELRLGGLIADHSYAGRSTAWPAAGCCELPPPPPLTAPPLLHPLPPASSPLCR